MKFKDIPIGSLIRIVLAGGGLMIDVRTRTADDLIRLASASKNKEVPIVLRGLQDISVDEMVKIASAGRGNVVFKE